MVHSYLALKVSALESKSLAAQAGFCVGDVIVAIQSRAVFTLNSSRQILEETLAQMKKDIDEEKDANKKKPLEDITFDVLRAGTASNPQSLRVVIPLA